MACIYRRPDSSYWWFKDDDGFCFSTKILLANEKEANDYLEDYKAKKRSSRLGTPNRRAKLEQFIDDYDADLKRRRRKFKTVRRALQVVRAFREATGLERMFDVNDDAARKWLEDRNAAVTAGDISLGTLALEIRTLQAAWNRAIVLKMADQNPFAVLDVNVQQGEDEDPEPPRFLNEKERDLLFGAAARERDEWDERDPYMMAQVYVWAGLRLQEGTHVWAEDFDLERNWVVVRKKPCDQCPGCRAQGNMWTPKDYERRRIPMEPTLKRELLKDARRGRRGPGLFFRRYGEKVWQERAVEKLFARLYKAAGIRDANVKTLRHTFGSEMTQRGVHVRVLQKWMGHGKIDTTMIYSHVDDEHHQEAMRRAVKGRR